VIMGNKKGDICTPPKRITNRVSGESKEGTEDRGENGKDVVWKLR